MHSEEIYKDRHPFFITSSRVYFYALYSKTLRYRFCLTAAPFDIMGIYDTFYALVPGLEYCGTLY